MRGRTICRGQPSDARTGRVSRFGIERALLIAVFAGGLWACASAPSYPYANGVDSDGHPLPQHFLVLPLNLAIGVPPGLEGSTDDVFSEIASYLLARGNTIETLSPESARARWRSATAEVSASDELPNNFETAMKVFTERARETLTFDALIVPALVMRDTEMRDKKVKWDGVIRKYKTINLSEEAKKKKIAGQVVPEFLGISLHVTVFGPTGDAIFQGYGGLDLAHDLDMYGAARTMRAKLSLKSDLLKSGKYLREGMEHAFDPYLPMD